MPAAEDCAAFDQLPPRCRAVIHEAILPWSASKVLEKFIERGLDLKNPEHDRAHADELARIDRDVAARTRLIGLTKAQKRAAGH